MRRSSLAMFCFVLASAFGLTRLDAADGQIDILPDGATTYVIDSPGSYVLVDNVQMTEPVTCIQITANNVTLDLNGHTMAGVGPGGSEIGIDASAALNAKVVNGTVRAFGGQGIVLHHHGRVERMFVWESGSHGIALSSQAYATEVHIAQCGGWGITAGDLATIVNCGAISNNGNGNTGGISVGPNSVVRNCQSRSNNAELNGHLSAIGIQAGTRSQISGNSVYLNGARGSATGWGIKVGDFSAVVSNLVNDGTSGVEGPSAISIGIQAETSCEILDNQVHNNRVPSAAGGGRGYGILALDRCLIRGNSCQNNSGEAGVSSTGIEVANGCRVENNHCSFHLSSTTNLGILVTGTDNTIVKNTTASNTTAGIRLTGSGNYAGENLLADSFSNLGTNTTGTSDRSNVSF